MDLSERLRMAIRDYDRRCIDATESEEYSHCDDMRVLLRDVLEVITSRGNHAK
jgi:hypothetical protein